jgi:beta-glucanase (GH16 family)
MSHGSTELQLYVASSVSVRDGTLVLTTRAEAATGPQGQQFEFTSGWVHSRSLRWQRHGRFEVRAQLPSPSIGRPGMWPTMWPAHWLMPEPTKTEPPDVCWPVGGEIDVMEGFRPRVGGDNRPLHTSVLQTYHWVSRDRGGGGGGSGGE